MVAAAAVPKPPNVVLILTDDQGWGDVNLHGNGPLQTPVLDALAESGARFERFFVSPVCAPTRASLLTGRYALRTGVSGVTHAKEYMRLDEVTLADMFKHAGYATGCFGKWHNGDVYPYHPNGRGFDEFFGFSAGHWNNYFDTTLDHNGKEFKTEGYIIDVLTDAAIDFITEHHDEPFFCYVPYNTPHSPFQVPDKWFDKYKARGFDDTLACVYGMVDQLDHSVGRILSALDKNGIAEETIVIFLGDNGPNTDRYNGAMRGRKGSVHEGGVRQATFMRWPGKIAPGTIVKPIAAHIDILPTLAVLTGVHMPKTKPLDGINLAPLLTGEADTLPDRQVFSHWAGRGALRTQQYRYVRERNGDALFDMVQDPGQQHDVSDNHPERTVQFRNAYDDWYAAVTAQGLEPPPLPVGHPDRPCATLLAPAARLEDGVTFEGGKGWANDWVSNWTTTAGKVSWDVEVGQPGTYEIALGYVCKPKNVDARMTVSIAGQTLTAVVDEAHDPAPLPSPDRVPRKEVYEKVWATLSMGEVTLPAGRTKVVVRAKELAGPEAIDLKYVQVCRVGSPIS
jgi:arylsulfatase A